MKDNIGVDTQYYGEKISTLVVLPELFGLENNTGHNYYVKKNQASHKCI